jgi:hypothetical protein
LPRVPSYNKQVSEQAIRIPNVSTQAPAELFNLGRSSQGVENAANNLLKTTEAFYQDQKKSADQIAIQDYDSSLSRLQSDLTKKAETFRGKDAAGALQAVQEEWEKGLADLNKGLTNTDQQMMAKKAAQNRYDSLYRSVDTYSAVELKKYENESTENYIKVQKDLAVQNYKDPLAVADSTQRQTDALREYQRRNGLSDDWFTAKSTESISKTNTDIVARMIDNGEDLLAKKYFEANKASFSGEDIGKVEKFVRAGSIRGESFRVADQVYRSGKTGQEALDEIRRRVGTEDVDLFKATKDQYKEIVNEQKAYADQKNSQTLESAYDTYILKNNGPIPTTLLEEMDAANAEKLQSLYANKVSGKTTETNWEVYFDIKSKLANPRTRNEMLSKSPIEFFDSLGATERKEVVNLWTDAKSGNTQELSFSEAEEKLTAALSESLGFNKEKSLAFKTNVHSAILAKEAQLGRRLGYEEMNAVVKSQATESVLVPGAIFGTNARFPFEVTIEDYDLEDIPETDVDLISAAIRAEGGTPTKKNVIERYVRRLQLEGSNVRK